MKQLLSSLLLFSFLSVGSTLGFSEESTVLAQVMQAYAATTPQSPESPAFRPPLDSEQAERARLEALPPAAIPIQDANLAAAIQIIAGAAGMNFVAPDSADFSDSVTLSAKLNPWRLLQILGERYHFHAVYQQGLWLFTRDNPSVLVARTYTLKHTNLDVYKSAQNSFNMLSAESGSGEGGQSSQSASGGMVFTPQTQKIIEDIKELVRRPAAITQEAPSAPARTDNPGPREFQTASATGQVLYLPDANALYVTATARQHDQVVEYLKLVDRPVRQIRIEARFFETSHDPRMILGLDPSGFQPGLSLSDVKTQVDLGRLGATPYPDKALLAMDSMRFQVNALQTDEKSKLVNNPTVVVANNREAYFSVGDEEPFVSANSINASGLDGGFGSTQARVAIRRIGTSVNLVPTYFPGDTGSAPRIRIAVRIEVGVLKGFRHLNTVDVPVVSSQKYEYTVFLKAGETLAFGGLSGVVESDSVKKVPIAGDIPVLGYVFRSHDKRSSQRNLVAYLTASLVEDGAAPAVPTPAVESKL